MVRIVFRAKRSIVALAACLGCSPSPRVARPASVELPPATSSAQAPTPAPARFASNPSERERLEAECFAEPWVPADARSAPKTLSGPEAERLAVLLKADSNGCRDVHPELPPGRFSPAYPIPLAECHYGIARLYFEARHWSEAARWFRRVAVEHAEADIGVFAVQLYLESLNVLGGSASTRRMACFELMAQEAELFACLYCGKPTEGEQCDVLRRIRFEARHLVTTGAPPKATDPSALPPMVPADCPAQPSRK